MDHIKNQIASDVMCALLEGDFSEFAAIFSKAGYQVDLPAPGILQIAASYNDGQQLQGLQRLRLLISVGIHGDETAPIEMLAVLLTELSHAPQQLAVDLMIVVGNLDAVAQGRRYIEADLNRMFTAKFGDMHFTLESVRADLIMRACAAFFSPPSAQKWHLDLHTTIRRSRYATFAIIPDSITDIAPDIVRDADKAALIGWLGTAGIAAAVLNNKPAGTFSAYTASQFGATSCTAELGQVAAIGQNDLTKFSAMHAALYDLIYGLISSANTALANQMPPVVFKVQQELMKHSENFKLAFDASTENFTEMAPDTVIATDGELVYSVGETREYVIFPNPDVQCGQRAGLMLVHVVKA